MSRFTAGSIYKLFDDFGDNKYSNRDRVKQNIGGINRRSRFSTTCYPKRPEWTVESGTWSVSAGRLTKNKVAAQEVIYCTSPTAYGTWQWNFQFDAITNWGILQPYFIYVDATHHYFLFHGNDSEAPDWNFMLKGRNGGAEYIIINPANVNATTTLNTAKITRDKSGNWEIFYNGVSKGTSTDNNVTTSTYFRILADYENANQGYFDNLKVL